jgi:hypothetical protein
MRHKYSAKKKGDFLKLSFWERSSYLHEWIDIKYSVTVRNDVVAYSIITDLTTKLTDAA